MAKIQGLSNGGSTSITINTRPTPMTFNGTEVPAPLPLAGAFFAFGVSRKLRSRIRSAPF
jgi:hypothetical protein